MKLAAKCFIEARQIFMNNSESSVLKCKVCLEWGWRPRCFLSELGLGLCFQRLVGLDPFRRSPESSSFLVNACTMEQAPGSGWGFTHRQEGFLRAGGMASLMCLPCRRENMSLIPMIRGTVGANVLIPSPGRQKSVDP